MNFQNKNCQTKELYFDNKTLKIPDYIKLSNYLFIKNIVSNIPPNIPSNI